VSGTPVGHDVRPGGNAELVRRSAMRDPDAVALAFGERRWAYGELWEAVRGGAAELAA
jgi:non-ribosomal peptide synthetase component E (peptide arylation enzyme)